jgi:DNA modification methylase
LLFLGSGTSLIAAEMTGRTCIGIEIRPAYVDVILRRWQAFTGRTAIHQASGQSFNERAANQDLAPSGATDA